MIFLRLYSQNINKKVLGQISISKFLFNKDPNFMMFSAHDLEVMCILPVEELLNHAYI